MAFEIIVETMMEMTIFQLFFPWLLVLAITYGALEKYQVISEDTSVNGVIALAIAFMAVAGSYLFIPEGLLSHVIAALTFTIFAIISLLIVMAVAGFDLEKLTEDRKSLPLLLGVGIFLISLFALVPGYLPVGDLVDLLTIELFEEVILPILILALIFGVVAITVLADSSEDE